MSILGNENVPLSLSEFQIFDRMLERNITSDELQEYIDYALAIFNQWNGKRKLFISEKGASVVMLRDNEWICKTGMRYTDCR